MYSNEPRVLTHMPCASMVQLTHLRPMDSPKPYGSLTFPPEGLNPQDKRDGIHHKGGQLIVRLPAALGGHIPLHLTLRGGGLGFRV